MAEGRRPGGLTALAVLNFVFGGLGAIGVLLLFGLLAVAKKIVDTAEKTAVASGDVETQQEIAELNEAVASSGALWIAILLSVISVGLIIASGVGYLGQKKFLGRTLGNAYGITALVKSMHGILFLQGTFSILTILFLVYPILTLILVNTTFKDDLVN